MSENRMRICRWRSFAVSGGRESSGKDVGRSRRDGSRSWEVRDRLNGVISVDQCTPRLQAYECDRAIYSQPDWCSFTHWRNWETIVLLYCSAWPFLHGGNTVSSVLLTPKEQQWALKNSLLNYILVSPKRKSGMLFGILWLLINISASFAAEIFDTGIECVTLEYLFIILTKNWFLFYDLDRVQICALQGSQGDDWQAIVWISPVSVGLTLFLHYEQILRK